MKGLSDETIVSAWVENPYWQYFCGMGFFQHKLPIDPSSLSRWRSRIGESGCERLLQVTIDAGVAGKVVKRSSLKKVAVDTTVQEKAVSYPTDSKLLEHARCKLVQLAEKHGLSLRQNYNRTCPLMAIKISRYAHARQSKRIKRELRRLSTRVGRVVRDIERQLNSLPQCGKEELELLLQQARQIIVQSKNRKHGPKLYSLYRSEV